MLSLRTLLPCTKGIIEQSSRALSRLSAAEIAGSRALGTLRKPHFTFALQQHRLLATNADPNDLSVQERIYYGSLTSRMRAVKVFSLSTSIAGLAAQPILMEQGMKLGGTGLAVLFCSVGGFFTFVTPLLLHFITKKYVTEIHYNPATEEYTATTISIILLKKQTKFRPSDVKVPEVPGMFTSFMVGKKALFVDPAMFENPEHYVRIMGYDKPVDFKLNFTKDSAPKIDDIKEQQK